MKRFAGFAVLLGGLWVGSRFLAASQKMVSTTVRYLLATPPPTEIEAVYRKVGDPDPVGRFTSSLTGAPVVHKAHLPKGEIEVTVRLGPGGSGGTAVRRFEADEDRDVTLSLERP